jgi:hypothetical protein
MIQYTTVYEVWGCDTGTYPRMDALFIDLKSACKFAVANEGKIHYHLPEVVKKTYIYDPVKQTVDIQREDIKPGQIYYMNKI